MRIQGTWQRSTHLVLDWALAKDVRPDNLQQRAGWPWLHRRALRWQRAMSFLAAGGDDPWPCDITRMEEDGLVAVAMEDACQLADAAEAFHNCVTTYADRCRAGTVRLFVVSEAASGRRLAVAGLGKSKTDAGWRLFELAGIPNQPVPERIAAFARRLAHGYDARARSAQ